MNRQDFPILRRKIKGHPLIYFDNAATMQKPRAVIKAISRYYEHSNANVHRGLNPLSLEATKLYENARQSVADFISARPEEIIFTRNATEGINLVARSWGENNLGRGQIVVLSQAEHHANIVPWLQLKEKLGIRLVYLPIKADGSLDLKAAQKIIARPGVKFLSLTQASNVLGVVNSLKALIKTARQKGIVTLIDACQSSAHLKINVRDLASDFLVLSGHKLGAPTGIGLLYGRKEILADLDPFLGGGGMIAEVYEDKFIPREAPYKFEAGTPAISGAIGLAAACDYLKKLGKKREVYEKKLSAYFLKKLSVYPFIKMFGTAKPKLSIFSLTVKRLHPHDLADLLGQEGIIVRAGQHCAQPLHDAFSLSSTLRVSLSFYNTTAEIDFFFKKLEEIYSAFNK